MDLLVSRGDVSPCALAMPAMAVMMAVVKRPVTTKGINLLNIATLFPVKAYETELT
jgi:hypothetical protein